MNFYFLDMSPKAKSNSSKGPTQAPTQKVEVESEKTHDSRVPSWVLTLGRTLLFPSTPPTGG